MTTTTTRKPKPRTLSYSRLTGILHITQGTQCKGYFVDRLDSDLGPAYRLTKIIPPADGQPREYDVLVLADGGGDCGCLGNLRHGSRGTVCRHIAAVNCLRERGALS